MSKRKRQRRQRDRLRQTGRSRSIQNKRELVDAVLGRAAQILDQLGDPETPVAELATMLSDLFDRRPVPASLPEALLESGRAIEELDQLVEELSAVAPVSLTALTFAASVCRMRGDAAAARVLLDRAMLAADEMETRLALAGNLTFCGRVVDALDLVTARLSVDPRDSSALAGYADALHAAYRHELEPPEDCPCGSGRDWLTCCATREKRALEDFADRSGLYECRTAVRDFLEGTAYGKAADQAVIEWLEDVQAEQYPDQLAQLATMATELAWQTASLTDRDSTEDNPLTAFAQDEKTDGRMAKIALDWRDHVHYGLWQVRDVAATPGIWVTELVTGVKRYLAVPPEQLAGLVRWQVIFGPIVSVAGVWRTTGAFIVMAPDEADAVCEMAIAACDEVLHELVGKRRRAHGISAGDPIPFGRAAPRGVLISNEPELPMPFARIAGLVVGSMSARVVHEFLDFRSRPAAMTNTDGDTLTLIRAQLRVGDPDALADALGRHPDFATDDDALNRWAWLGPELAAGQHPAMLAEIRAELVAQGVDETELADEDSCRLRLGSLVRDGSRWVLDVNSEQRRERLLTRLRELGAQVEVLDESRIDPAQDFAWGLGPALLGGGLAPPGQGWDAEWLDHPVPDLGGLTPREAADSEDWPLVEALLRRFEHDADLLARAGRPGIDVNWLREQLDLTD